MKSQVRGFLLRLTRLTGPIHARRRHRKCRRAGVREPRRPPEWFDDYLSAFGGLGRGELDDPRVLLDYYAVPLLLTTDDAALALTTEDDVVDAVRRQIAGLRDAGYDRSQTIRSELSVLNARTALYAAE